MVAGPFSSPFRVIDKPYVIWSHDPAAENMDFLGSIDSDFYERTVQTFFCDDDGNLRFDSENNEARRDVSSFARLVWNHGLETLVTLLGAYVQAPHAVHGFFLKCENKDCRKIASYLLSGQIPESNFLVRSEFDFLAFVRGIHARSPWINDEPTMRNFACALSEMLSEYDRDDLRAEYNSIKHGLRARHGRFAIALGLQESIGIPAPKENMTMLSDSRDGSHFLALQAFQNLSKKDTREQFSVRQRSLGWSLVRTLLDIQLFTCLIGNIVGALKIAAGATPETVQFFRPDVGEDWWQEYFNERVPSVQNSSFGLVVDIPKVPEDAEKQVTKFYRDQTKAKRIAKEADGLIEVDPI